MGELVLHRLTNIIQEIMKFTELIPITNPSSNPSLPQQIYPYIVEAAGTYSVFFFFGSLCLIFSVLSTIIIPKIRGKSLEQIQDYFEKKSLKLSNSDNKTNCSSQLKTEEKKTDRTDDGSLSTPHLIVFVPSTEKINVITEKEETTKL